MSNKKEWEKTEHSARSRDEVMSHNFVALPSLATLSLMSSSTDVNGTQVGEKRKKKPPRTVESGLVKLKATQNKDSLNLNGVLSMPLPTAIDSPAFLSALGASTNNWFHTNFELMLDFSSHEPGHLTAMFFSKKNNVEYPEIVAAYAAWNNLAVEKKLEYRQRINLGTEEGMQLVFDPDYLKKRPWFQSMPGKDFFMKAVSFVRMGNTVCTVHSNSAFLALSAHSSHTDSSPSNNCLWQYDEHARNHFITHAHTITPNCTFLSHADSVSSIRVLQRIAANFCLYASRAWVWETWQGPGPPKALASGRT